MIRRSSLQAYFAGALVVLGTAAFAGVAAGKPVESFTAVASAKVDANSKDAVQVDVRIAIDRWANDEERGSVMKAVKTGGTPALHKLLTAMPDSGTIEVGLKKVAIKYAFAHPTGAGRIVTIVTADPIHHLGGSLPDAKPKAGYDVAVALLILEGAGGHGELAPAAKVKTNADGAIVIDDYGSAKVWLKDVKAK